MKIITYSDIHLEFGHNCRPPKDIEGDVMLLAGDMVTFHQYKPLKYFLTNWQKPVIYIARQSRILRDQDRGGRKSGGGVDQK